MMPVSGGEMEFHKKLIVSLSKSKKVNNNNSNTAAATTTTTTTTNNNNKAFTLIQLHKILSTRTFMEMIQWYH